MGCSFNLLVATKNRINAIWETVPKFSLTEWLKPTLILVRNLSPLLLSASNTWLGSCLMNFSINFLKKLQEAELRILISILFHIIKTVLKKQLKKGFPFFNTSRSIGVSFSEIS